MASRLRSVNLYIYISGRSVMALVGNRPVTQVQILYEVVGISHSANTLRKRQNGLCNLSMAISLGERKVLHH